MNIVVVELPAKAKTINKYLGPRLRGAGLVRPCARPAGQGRLGRSRRTISRMLWEVDAKAQKRLNDIARAVKGADKLILATDPDREGEAISWHVLEVLKEKKALKAQAIERVVFNAITKTGRARGDEASARRSTARWSTPIWRAARSIIWSASRSRRCCGASCRAPARPAACSRWRCGWSATASSRSRSSSPANTGRWWPRSRRRAARRSRRASSAPTARRSSGSTSAPARRPRRFKQALESRRLHGRLGRGQARQAQSAAALHHLDPAAGSQPQARLRARPHHADRAAALRGRRHRRRDGRPHHLYANRRRADRRGGDRRRPQADRHRTTASATCRPPPRQYQTKAKNAQEAHEAIRPTDFSLRPAEAKRVSSIPTRPGSTS